MPDSLKTIQCSVRCQYWDRPEMFEVCIPDGATDEEIENLIREAAMEAAGIEYWTEDVGP